ncbi:MAG: hypothetical protein IH595_01510 [Bacteroidales bacterium]|nr:hypothetical protein [Bacteroidales bacterium]
MPALPKANEALPGANEVLPIVNESIFIVFGKVEHFKNSIIEMFSKKNS